MAEEKNVQEVEIKSEVKTEAENEKIRKSNFNICFFMNLPSPFMIYCFNIIY